MVLSQFLGTHGWNRREALNHMKLLAGCFFISVVLLISVACNTSTPTDGISQPKPTTATAINSTKVIAATAETPIRVLFIGNSLTFFNDLPGIFAELAQSGSYEVEVAMIAQGGWTLADHAQSSATMEKIQGDSWDTVVLQEQSRLPAIQDQRDVQMVPAIRLLDEQIKENGAETILFMTWGSRDGLPEAGYADYAAMQAQIQASYEDIAEKVGAGVAPVGIAWQKAIEVQPDLDLWQLDGIHPTREGTYLSALVFYTLIFQQSPAGLIFHADLPEETAEFLQVIAAETVLENFEDWNIP